MFLKQCKYIEREKKVIGYITDYITDDVKFSSDYSDESDEE